MEWLGVIFRMLIFMGFAITVITAVEIVIFVIDVKEEHKGEKPGEEQK